MIERVKLENLENAMISKETDSVADSQVEFLNTGSTILNLVLSGKGSGGGWARNRVINIVGDGSSGKTLLAMEAIAHSINAIVGQKSTHFPEVKNIRIRYNNVERVLDFDIKKIWGLNREKIEWVSSESIQEFGRDFGRTSDKMADGDMVLYFLDSLDSLPSEEEVDRFRKSQKDDETADASFNLEKQKYFGQFFRSSLLPKMEGRDITLFIISQVRTNIGVTFGEKLYRTGGKSLDFYTHQVCWLYEKEKMPKTVRGHNIIQGIRIRAKLKRSKVSRPFREGEFSMLFDYGIDNVGSNIDYLFDLGGKKTGDNIEWDSIKFKSRSALILYIEEKNQEGKLSNAVEGKWLAIEEEASGSKGRKPRF